VAEETKQDCILREDREHEEQPLRPQKELANLGISIETQEVCRDVEIVFDKGEKEIESIDGNSELGQTTPSMRCFLFSSQSCKSRGGE